MDPGFHVGGGANPPEGGNIWFFQIFQKTAWNWEHFGPCGDTLGAPLGTATVLGNFLDICDLIDVFVSIFVVICMNNTMGFTHIWKFTLSFSVPHYKKYKVGPIALPIVSTGTGTVLTNPDRIGQIHPEVLYCCWNQFGDFLCIPKCKRVSTIGRNQ